MKRTRRVEVVRYSRVVALERFGETPDVEDLRATAAAALHEEDRLTSDKPVTEPGSRLGDRLRRLLRMTRTE